MTTKLIFGAVLLISLSLVPNNDTNINISPVQEVNKTNYLELITNYDDSLSGVIDNIMFENASELMAVKKENQVLKIKLHTLRNFSTKHYESRTTTKGN